MKMKDGVVRVASDGKPTRDHPVNASVSIVRLNSEKTAILFRLEQREASLDEFDDSFWGDPEYELSSLYGVHATIVSDGEISLSVGQCFSPETAFVLFCEDARVRENRISVMALEGNRAQIQWTGGIREVFRSERTATMECECWATLKKSHPLCGIAWQLIFDEPFYRLEAANDFQIRHLTDNLFRPIAPAELKKLKDSFSRLPADSDWFEKHFAASEFRIPNGPLPDSYISFLKWSNGGHFNLGDRVWQMWSSEELRRDLLNVTMWMPCALPIAMNGGGVYYLIDMREPPVNGEYPIVAAHAGNLSWDADSCTHVADSFVEACVDWRNIESLR